VKSGLQTLAPTMEHEARSFDAPRPSFDFSGPWFDSRTAAAYIPCKSVKGFYEWCRRHFIVRRSNGSVAKADLDRALKAKRAKRVMAAASLANLRKRKAS